MWRKLSHIIIWMAWMLLLGHDLTPHDHSQGTSVSQLGKADLIEFVFQLFSHDMGDEHLEFYEDASTDLDTFSPLPKAVIAYHSLVSDAKPPQVYTQTLEVSVVETVHSLPSLLRGPPVSN